MFGRRSPIRIHFSIAPSPSRPVLARQGNPHRNSEGGEVAVYSRQCRFRVRWAGLSSRASRADTSSYLQWLGWWSIRSAAIKRPRQKLRDKNLAILHHEVREFRVPCSSMFRRGLVSVDNFRPIMLLYLSLLTRAEYNRILQGAA